jgi:hypothetical protein
MELFKDTHLIKLELLSNATTIIAHYTTLKQAARETPGLRFISDDYSSNGQIAKGRQTVF